MVCGDKASVKDVREVDYDALCNLPARELLSSECADLLEIKGIIKQVVVVDTREKNKVEELKEKVVHIPLFELKGSLEKISEISKGKKISTLFPLPY